MFIIVLLSFVLAWRAIGLGYHVATVAAINPEHPVTGALYMYVATYFFDGAVALSKVAAICFYARVLSLNNRNMRIHLWITGALSASWLIASWISDLLQCRPLPGTLLSLALVSISSSDLYILILPIPLIWHLHLSLRRRIIILLLTFFMAYSVVFLSIGRLVTVAIVVHALDDNLTWRMPEYLYWVMLELSISIISINVPSGIAVVKFFLRSRQSRSSGVTESSNWGERSSNAVARLNQPNSRTKLVPEAETSSLGHANDEDISLGDIRIQTDVQQLSSREPSLNRI
ncbi:hypothetical protein BDV06DRAFT_224615 [Aspergillus oleicola]